MHLFIYCPQTWFSDWKSEMPKSPKRVNSCHSRRSGMLSLGTSYYSHLSCLSFESGESLLTLISKYALLCMGVPRRQPHRHSGLATLPSVGAVPQSVVTPYYCKLALAGGFAVFCIHVCLLYVWFVCVLFVPSVLWYCFLGLLTCKNRLPYNLYCVGEDVKHCPIQSNPY